MTKDELKQQYIKWAERCGVAEELGEDLEKWAEESLQNIPPRILEMAGETDIEKTTITAVLSTRFILEWGDKNLDARTSLFAFCCSEILYQMQSELAALKEKYRWRNVDEEEPPRETEVLICCVSRSGAHKYVYTASFDGEDFYDRRGDSPSGEVKYWRPLDLPEMEEAK